MKAKSFRKTFPMLPAIALTAATFALTAAFPARATTFIKDVMLIGGTSGETTTLKNSLTTNGWTFINYDLNKGCGSSSDYVYLLYKAEADTSGDRDYVTGFYIKSGASNVTTTFTSGGKTYTLTPYYGGSHFNDQKGDLNSNAGGDAIHLYYTKDASSGRAVSSVAFNTTEDGALGANGASSPGYDLNNGCGGDTAYIYMHVTTSLVTYGLTYDLAGGSLPSGTSNPATYTATTATITLNNPTRTGYTFLGWTWDGQSTPVKTVTIPKGSTGNRSYIANWSATPVGRIDVCTGGEAKIAVSGWAYDPDVPAQSINVQVKIYKQDGTTLVTQETFTADRPRDDVNSSYHLTGQHGYSATIDIADAGTYKVKVFAIDYNGDGDSQVGSTQTVTVTPAPVVLTSSTGEVTLQDGSVLTGTGGRSTHVVIAAGATVTLSGVNIDFVVNDFPFVGNPRLYRNDWPGITCEGDATIILANGTTNTMYGGNRSYPGIQIGPSGTTLTIRGNGTLKAHSGRSDLRVGDSDANSAGIGGSSGDIVIEGGTIVATGWGGSAGIGATDDGVCGNITITGGNVTGVCGGQNPTGAGIGSPSSIKEACRCGNITISGGTVTATGGAPTSGLGGSNCGSITISGGTVEATGIGGYTCGAIAISGGTVTSVAVGLNCVPGIGCTGGTHSSCGDISISGGVVTAIGSDEYPGIGATWGGCGMITINGGTVVATGGAGAPGIGCGDHGRCTGIVVTEDVYSLAATKGEGAPYSIGPTATYSNCGNMTIVGVAGQIAESPFYYPSFGVTMKEGTEDAANWTISPARAPRGGRVTVIYTGNKKVKSIKAVKK